MLWVAQVTVLVRLLWSSHNIGINVSPMFWENDIYVKHGFQWMYVDFRNDIQPKSCYSCRKKCISLNGRTFMLFFRTFLVGITVVILMCFWCLSVYCRDGNVECLFYMMMAIWHILLMKMWDMQYFAYCVRHSCFSIEVMIMGQCINSDDI